MYCNRDLGGARRVASQPFAKITIDPEPCMTMVLEKLHKKLHVSICEHTCIMCACAHTHVHTHTCTHMHTHTHTTDSFGSAELKKEFLAPSVAGDVVACLGVSEVGSGSDVASIKTTAVPKKGQLIC